MENCHFSITDELARSLQSMGCKSIGTVPDDFEYCIAYLSRRMFVPSNNRQSSGAVHLGGQRLLLFQLPHAHMPEVRRGNVPNWRNFTVAKMTNR
jgi:hypothetical protein